MAPELLNPFAPAVKAQLKARVAFCGPTGSGKTWTALKWAAVLAGEDGRVAFIDTERDSAKLYANHFDFDVLRFDPPYEVARLVELLHTAEQLGYAVVVVDSLSHFWEGEGGVLDEVDAAGARSGGNSFAGWKHGTPLQRHMVDTFLAVECHVIVCMRSKMEYLIEEYTDGKNNKRSRPVKMGMAPVQRGGLEYEFTIVGDLDLEHRITFTKSRCDVLADKMIQPNRETDAAKLFAAWLDDGEPPPPPADQEQVTAFLADVKGREENVRHAMNVWWKEHGYVAEKVTVPELAAAREHLADLLLADTAGEPAESGDASTSDTTEGDDENAVGATSSDADADLPGGADETNGQGELAVVKSA